MAEQSYAWAGDIASFVATSDEDLLDSLTRFTRETGAPQLFAWYQSIGVFKQQLGGCLPAASGFGLVMEFALPRTGGRRPDLILLENGTVIVVEFKNRLAVEPSDIDQVLGYVRDLADYHAGCHARTLVPVLVPMGMTDPPFTQSGVQVIPPSALGDLVRGLSRSGHSGRADVKAWTDAPYEPLPGLIEAAQLLFEHQPLPRIRRHESLRISDTVSMIEAVVQRSMSHGTRTLVVLTGVPGAGKTLVGLTLAHSRALALPALFVSGNGPLVQVLQYALGGGKARREFVQDLRSFLLDNFVRSKAAPRERVVIFDEAQRAWDASRVLEKYRGQLTGSQPSLFVRLADRTPGEPFVLVALIGEGQEIHAGEEAGIQQWVDAVRASHGWEVVAPEHIAKSFASAGLEVTSEPLLNLTSTLRSHRASDTAKWANLLIAGQLTEASSVAASMRNSGFCLYVSRDLERLRQYAHDRFGTDPGRRYGLLASSKFRTLEEFGVQSVRSDYWYYGEWYEEGRANQRSCCRLETAVTEFGCQGLELDLPILCWGPDFVWEQGQWKAKVGKSRLVIDPARLRANSYRVLLTRGREGICVFVPPVPADPMDGTYRALLDAGFLQFES